MLLISHRPCSSPAILDLTYFDLLADPGDDLVEDFAERCAGSKAQQRRCLFDFGRPLLHVVFVSRIADVTERPPLAMDFPPNQLRSLEDRCPDWSGKIEVLVQRRL